MSYPGNYFFRVDLLLSRYLNGAKTTASHAFVSKALKDNALAANFWPILQSVGEIAFTAGDVLPTLTLGAIEIDNSVGSFGTGRKFSDILQPGYYSAVNAPVTIQVAQVGNDSDTVSSWTTIATGVVSDWESPMADGGGTLVFNVQPTRFDEKILTLEVARTVSGMSAAPDSSLGRAVPLFIGKDQPIIPVRVSADGAATARYAYGTCLYQHLMPAPYEGYLTYSKNPDDAWEAWNYGGVFDYNSSIAGSHTLNTYDSRAWLLNINSATLITGVTLFGKGNGSGGRTSSAYLDVFLLRSAGITNVVEDPVARGTVTLSNYDASNNAGTADFPIKVCFDRPVFISVYYEYYLGFRVRNFAVNELSLNYAAVFRAELRQDDSDANTSGGAWAFAGASRVVKHEVHNVTMALEDHVDAYTQSGLTYGYIELQQVAPDSGQESPSFDTLPIAMRMAEGLTTYPASPGALAKDSPHELAALLAYNWNGSAWVDTASWDSTSLAATHYAKLYAGGTSHRARTASGVFDSKVTFAQVIQELARGTASRVGIYSGGKAFMYPWGVTQAPAFDIPHADVSALSWQQRDISTVVNRCVLNLGKNYLAPPRSFENAEGTSSGFMYSTDFAAGNYPQVEYVTRESRAMYGNKDLAATSFPIYPFLPPGGNYMGGEGSVIAEYYLTRFAKPAVYCSFIVPWHRYNGMKMFDVITFSTPAFPAYFGADPDPRQGWVVDTGSTVEVVDVNSGYDLVQAQTYRGLVEGLSYVLAMEHAPALRVTVLVLQNHAIDPT